MHIVHTAYSTQCVCVHVHMTSERIAPCWQFQVKDSCVSFVVVLAVHPHTPLLSFSLERSK